MGLHIFDLGWILLAVFSLDGSLASLIASSEIQACSRTTANSEPMSAEGESCSQKFVVSLAVQSGQVCKLMIDPINSLICSLQGESGTIYATIKHVEESKPSEDGQLIRSRKQLTKPLRIVVTKSDVYVAYPLKLLKVILYKVAD